MEEMISIAKVAKAISLTPRTILRMLRRDGVPIYRVGLRKLAVRKVDVLNWLERRRIQDQNQEVGNDEQ